MKLRNKKPKLLFLTEFFPTNKKNIFTGGVEARTFYLSQQAKKDFQVQVIFSRSKLIAATFLSVFARINYIYTSFIKAISSNFDLIEASNTTVYFPAFLAAKLKKKPAVAWYPDILGKDWFKFGKIVGSLGYFLEKLSLKLNWDQVIALSQATKQKLIKANLSANKITVAYGGIDPKEFNTKPVNKLRPFTIITIARLVKTKRIIDLVKAFKLVSQKHPQSQLIIIGNGPEAKTIKQFISNNQFGQTVKLFNSIPRAKLIKILKQSHLFCLPSVVEGFGLVTFEAFASGIPAVISNTPVHQEVTKKGQGVLFHKPQNPKHLSEQILKMIKNQKLYQLKLKQAKKLVKIYTWDKIYQQTKPAYQKTL